MCAAVVGDPGEKSDDMPSYPPRLPSVVTGLVVASGVLMGVAMFEDVDTDASEPLGLMLLSPP